MARFHPIIFAPDSNDPDNGPQVELERVPMPSMGMQTTLPAQTEDARLYDHKGNAVVRETPRRIGFIRG